RVVDGGVRAGNDGRITDPNGFLGLLEQRRELRWELAQVGHGNTLHPTLARIAHQAVDVANTRRCEFLVTGAEGQVGVPELRLLSEELSAGHVGGDGKVHAEEQGRRTP